jgi:hypothetical protein
MYGSVFAFKVVFLTTFFAYGFFTMFGVHGMPFEKAWVCQDVRKETGARAWMGADNLARCLMYLVALRFGMFKFTIPVAAVDTLYHGPHYTGAYTSALIIWLSLM